MRYLIFVTMFCLLACGSVRERQDDFPPANPTLLDLYHKYKDRLLNDHLDRGGWVVSRWEDGSPEHEGEALLWSGVLLTAIPCDEGDQVEDFLINVINDHGGALVRYTPLGEYAGGREITLDGAIGLYRGVAHRISHCDGSNQKWSYAFGQHMAYLDTHSNRFNANAPATLVPQWTYLVDLLAWHLDLGPEPHWSRLRALEAELATWVGARVAAKQPMFPANLSLLTLQAIEDLGGKISSLGADTFCEVLRPAKIPTVEHWCRREDITSFLLKFKLNEWEYRHQRGAWEEPDGKPGLRTPALDYLVGFVQKHGIPAP